MTIYIIAGIIYLIVTILVVVKICQTANNTAEIRDLLVKMQDDKKPKQTPKQEVSAVDENGNEKTIFQMRQEQKASEEQEKSLYEQQQEFWQ